MESLYIKYKDIYISIYIWNFVNEWISNGNKGIPYQGVYLSDIFIGHTLHILTIPTSH